MENRHRIQAPLILAIAAILFAARAVKQTPANAIFFRRAAVLAAIITLILVFKVIAVVILAIIVLARLHKKEAAQ